MVDPEDSHLHTHRRENLKSYNVLWNAIFLLLCHHILNEGRKISKRAFGEYVRLYYVLLFYCPSRLIPRLWSSGLWQYLVLKVVTNVSEERTASLFRVEVRVVACLKEATTTSFQIFSYSPLMIIFPFNLTLYDICS
jgi:hypothetical protein